MPKANSTSWRPGVSGNPKGRAPGTGKVATLREQINEAVPGIVKAMVDRALDGDPGAARLLVERVIPALRPEERSVTLNMTADAPLAYQGRALLAAVAAGDLAPSQASTLLAGLSTMAKLIETDELAARVAALEERANAKA
jgi:hypothetical protein